VLIALALSALISACTSDATLSPSSRDDSAPDRSRPRPIGEATVGVIGEPATLDPYSPKASDLTLALLRPVLPSLFRFLPTGEVHPSLALSLDEKDGGARVRLRDAHWSNGRRITARDVVASIRRARPPSGFARIVSARALSSRILSLRGAIDNWPEALATAALIYPREGLAVSGGPYRLASRTPGLELVYTPNDRWWGQPPRLRRVTVQFTANIDILMGLLRRGHFDAAAPPSTLGLASRLRSARLRSESALGWESIVLDFTRSDLTRSERVGVTEALDLRTLVGVFIRGYGRSSFRLHPGPGPSGAAGPWSRPLGTASRTTQVVEIAAPRDDELLGLLQEAIYEQLRSSGITSELSSIESFDYYGGWLDQEPVDVALKREAGAPSGRVGKAAFRALDAVPLAHVSSVLAWRPGLEGPEPNPTFEGPLWNLERWHFAGGG
jgi:hypothetical protein